MQGGRANRVDEDARLDGQTIQIDDTTYKVVRLIADNTSEAQIYLVEKGGRQYAFKHYYDRMPLTEENIEILSRITTLSGMTPSLVVPVYCFGQYNPSQRRFVSMHQGDKPQGGSRCFELMAYGEGGNLDAYCIRGDQQRLREMAIMLAAGIDLLHQKHILHRDIKPANCFFMDKERTMPVITDFGLSSLCRADGTLETTQYNNSPIFAAPEMYITPPGLNAVYRISTKSDFYALGLVLISIWMGSERFEKEFVGPDAITFRGLKTKGKLKLPDDLDDRNRSLLLALLDNDDQTRATFAEIAQWAEGKTNPFADRLGVKKVEEEDDFRIVFDRTNNIVAHSPEDLAHMLITKQDLGRDYVYNGYLVQEFNRLKHPELASLVAQIKEKFPKDKAAGLYTLALKLDPNVPYIDVKGKEMTGLKEIARTININFNAYLKNLTNAYDYLYLYLNNHGGREQTERLLKGMQRAETRRDALHRFITEIDPEAPFRFVTKDGTIRLCYDVKGVISLWEKGFRDDSWDDLVGKGFEAWLSVHNPTALSRIQAARKRLDPYIEDDDETAWQLLVLYNLDPETCDYFGDLDTESEDRCFNLTDLCVQFNLWLSGYETADRDSDWFNTCDIEMNSLANFKGGQLHIYLDSKLKYQKVIDVFSYVVDVYSEENQKKYAPNNWQICCYKALKAIGHQPCYVFRGREDKPVYTLEDLEKIPEKEQKDALRNWGLGNWLTILYHEDPTQSFKEKYAFEKEVVKYLDHIGHIDPSDKLYKRYGTAYSLVDSYTINANTARNNLVIAQNVPLFGIIALLVAAIGPAVWGIPLEGWNPLYGLADFAGIVMAGVSFIILWFVTSDAGCLFKLMGSIVIGALFGVAVWALGEYVLPYIGYILASILVVAAIALAVKGFLKPGRVLANLNKDTDLGFEQRYLEPLHYAMKAGEKEKFDSSIQDICEHYTKESKRMKAGFLRWGYTAIVVGIIVCIAYYGFSPAFNTSTAAYVHKQAECWNADIDSLIKAELAPEDLENPDKKTEKPLRHVRSATVRTATWPSIANGAGRKWLCSRWWCSHKFSRKRKFSRSRKFSRKRKYSRSHKFSRNSRSQPPCGRRYCPRLSACRT